MKMLTINQWKKCEDYASNPKKSKQRIREKKPDWQLRKKKEKEEERKKQWGLIKKKLETNKFNSQG